jgi:hypothetical protein
MEQNLDEIKRLLQQNIFAKAPQLSFNSYSQAVFKKLALCHTIGIGKHYYKCNNVSCNHVHTQYHCCGNRHCMNCGGLKRDQWIQDRMQELLPTTYFTHGTIYFLFVFVFRFAQFTLYLRYLNSYEVYVWEIENYCSIYYLMLAIIH